jgi:hypothetical protein
MRPSGVVPRDFEPLRSSILTPSIHTSAWLDVPFTRTRICASCQTPRVTFVALVVLAPATSSRQKSLPPLFTPSDATIEPAPVRTLTRNTFVELLMSLNQVLTKSSSWALPRDLYAQDGEPVLVARAAHVPECTSACCTTMPVEPVQDDMSPLSNPSLKRGAAAAGEAARTGRRMDRASATADARKRGLSSRTVELPAVWSPLMPSRRPNDLHGIHQTVLSGPRSRCGCATSGRTGLRMVGRSGLRQARSRDHRRRSTSPKERWIGRRTYPGSIPFSAPCTRARSGAMSS